MESNKEISLTKETVIKVLELYRSIHRDILKKIEDCDNTDVVDMGDEYVAEEIVKRLYMKKVTNKVTPEYIGKLNDGDIFVFGSNLEGQHAGGAAYFAYVNFGAIWGQGVGLQGRSYAIPTMHGPVETIAPYVKEFIDFAKKSPKNTFLVTPIGCGIAGFTAKEIAPLFKDAVGVENITLPQSFISVLEKL